MPHFEFGHDYEVTGRSLLLFILRPSAGTQLGSDALRSFQHVRQLFQETVEKDLVLPDNGS